MRGLPSSGKSYIAKELAGDRGVVCETDEYFFTQVGDDPEKYDYQSELLEKARDWNFERFTEVVNKGITPVVIDRGNGLTKSTQIYARYGVDNGYAVELREPESEWWQEIHVLLKYKQHTRPILRKWAEVLATMSKYTHRVPVSVIWHQMEKWKVNLTIDDILDYAPRKSKTASGTSVGQVSNPLRDGSSSSIGIGTLERNGNWVGEFLLDATEGLRSSNPNDKIVVTIPVADDLNNNTGSDDTSLINVVDEP